MNDRERLAGYLDTWATSISDFASLLDELDHDDWGRDTDLPGWDVKAVASHVAHLESLLAGGPDETAEVPEAPHITGPLGQFTEIGVITRRDRTPDSIIEEIRAAAETRRQMHAAAPPEDGTASAPGIFGAIGWNQQTLLRNRPLDVWMHEQDIRNAVGRPGGMDRPGAQHTADYLSEGFGFVVGKKVKPAAGTTAVLEVEGSAPVAVGVGDDGRATRLEDVPADPTVRIALGREAYLLAAGGRRTPEAGQVRVEGDADLAARIVAALGTTP